jgi:hypothetical protein
MAASCYPLEPEGKDVDTLAVGKSGETDVHRRDADAGQPHFCDDSAAAFERYRCFGCDMANLLWMHMAIWFWMHRAISLYYPAANRINSLIVLVHISSVRRLD